MKQRSFPQRHSAYRYRSHRDSPPVQQSSVAHWGLGPSSHQTDLSPEKTCRSVTAARRSPSREIVGPLDHLLVAFSFSTWLSELSSGGSTAPALKPTVVI